MTIVYLRDLKLNDALSLTRSFDEVRSTDRTVAVLAQAPRHPLSSNSVYKYGDMRFNSVCAAHETICRHSVASNVSGFMTDDVIALTFNQPSDYIDMMAKIRGTRTVMRGTDFEVQVHGKEPLWYQLMQGEVAKTNTALAQKGLPGIRAMRAHDVKGLQMNYIFPTIDTLRDFCDVMRKGEIDNLVRTQYLNSLEAR